MKAEESIANLEYAFSTMGADGDFSEEAVYMAIEALEKQIPYRVGYIGDGYADGVMVYDQAECPACGYMYDDTDSVWKEPFCPHCGQALKWEE